MGTRTSTEPVSTKNTSTAMIAHPVGRTCVNPCTSPTDRTPCNWSGVRPMIPTSSLSWASPSGPIVRVTRPGNRSSSSPSGVDSSSRCSAGDAATSPGPGARASPGGTGGSSPSAAR